MGSNWTLGRLVDRDTDSSEEFLGREKTWKFLNERPYIIGGYQWAATEHRGEAVWPTVCSKSGALDLFLDNAVLGKLNEVRIIHGKGTGALRAAVQSELRRKKFVRSFRLGVYGEGESGVTIAELDIS